MISGLCLASLAVVVSGMDFTTQKPETTTEDTSNRVLSLPKEEKCANRKCPFLVHDLSRIVQTIVHFFPGPITFTYDGHGYFYSGRVDEHKNDKVDWLEARNICR